MEITLQNVRSIVKKQTIPIVPLTLLVGENSSGKSTFLAALSIVCDSDGYQELGAKIGDPFQIMVTPSGRPANLLDVGYGVSQALPVVVQTILVDQSQLLLLQQPEVHLHPRAQAALGSFFVQQVSEASKRFVIETHSDFILDRIRQEVAAGTVNNDLVRILFLRKKQFETTIHTLRLDSLGNVIGAPPGYREFFLREELNLFNKTGGNGQ